MKTIPGEKVECPRSIEFDQFLKLPWSLAHFYFLFVNMSNSEQQSLCINTVLFYYGLIWKANDKA